MILTVNINLARKKKEKKTYGVQHLVTTKNVQTPILGIKKKKKFKRQGSHHVLSSIVGIVSQYILGAFGAGPHIIHST